MNYPRFNVTPSQRNLLIAGTIVLIGGVALGTIALIGIDNLKPQKAMTTNIASSTLPIPNAYANLHLIGEAAIVYDLKTGDTLYAQDADQALPLASLTKLITMYGATGVLQDSSPVTITPSALAQNGDIADLGFSEGETFAFKDISRLALVASSNTAAAAIEEAAAASKHVSDTQLLASAIANAGLAHTRATNGTGLDINTEEAGAYGSARDIAILAGTLLVKAPDIAGSTIATSITIRSKQGTVHALPNTNQDVVRVPGILLSKTGFTDLAGGNLVVVYDAGIGHPVAVVVLGSTRDGRFSDVSQLINATGAHFAGVGDTNP
jgi:D-alanyl-D-alanine carboxypeptidase (penicillin-binding protein 5/6)